MLTVSADKSAKVWAISEDGNGVVKKTLTCPITGGVEDMLVGCLWQNDYLVTVSLGGTISLFSASNLDKDPVTLCGHLKNVNSLAVVNTNQKVILSCSYDGLIFRWIQGIGFSGRLERKNVNNAQIKCFAAVEGEIVSSGYDNKVMTTNLFKKKHMLVSFQLSCNCYSYVFFLYYSVFFTFMINWNLVICIL